MVQDLAEGRLSAEAHESENMRTRAESAEVRSGMSSGRSKIGMRQLLRDLQRKRNRALVQDSEGSSASASRHRRWTPASIEQFFTTNVAQSDSAETSPVILHHARRTKALYKTKGGKAGRLRHLLPEQTLTPDEEVGSYLKHQGIKHVPDSNAKDSKVSKATFELEKHQMSRGFERREHEVQQQRQRHSRLLALAWPVNVTSVKRKLSRKLTRNDPPRPPRLQQAIETYADL